MAKKRLDVAMVEQGLAESRQKAQAIIMAGQVYVNGQKVDKAGAPVAEDAGSRRYLSLCQPGRSEAGKGHGLLAHRTERSGVR